MTLPADPVWFITGCSTGFGRELAKLVLDRGWRVVATARGKDRVADIVEIAPDRALAVDLDVTDKSQIDAAVAAAKDKFGRIDVLVNNAGYGYQSAIEEGEEQEIRDQFEANVFGLFAMTRAVLPVMREQGSGNIVNISSVGGLLGFPASGYYSATKHGLDEVAVLDVAQTGEDRQDHDCQRYGTIEPFVLRFGTDFDFHGSTPARERRLFRPVLAVRKSGMTAGATNRWRRDLPSP